MELLNKYTSADGSFPGYSMLSARFNKQGYFVKVNRRANASSAKTIQYIESRMPRARQERAQDDDGWFMGNPWLLDAHEDPRDCHEMEDLLDDFEELHYKEKARLAAAAQRIAEAPKLPLQPRKLSKQQVQPEKPAGVRQLQTFAAWAPAASGSARW